MNNNSSKTEQTKSIDNKMYCATLRKSYFDSTNSKVSDYKKDAGKESCIACTRSGQPCLAHMKTDKKIVDISDLLGGVTSNGHAPEEKSQLYGLVIAAYIKDVADQLPQGFANTKAVLNGIASLYLKQANLQYKMPAYDTNNAGAKTSSANYSAPESSKAYSGKESASTSYNKN